MPDDMLNYRSTEVLCRQIYGIEKAFEAVMREGEWKATKQQPKSWRSKVQYHILDEIDARALMSQTAVVPAVDAEVRDRLRDKALLIKAVEKSRVSSAKETNDKARQRYFENLATNWTQSNGRF